MRDIPGVGDEAHTYAENSFSVRRGDLMMQLLPSWLGAPELTSVPTLAQLQAMAARILAQIKK